MKPRQRTLMNLPIAMANQFDDRAETVRSHAIRGRAGRPEWPAFLLHALSGLLFLAVTFQSPAALPFPTEILYQQARVTNDPINGSQQFGQAVAISGDTVAVGGSETVLAQPNVHVFTRQGAAWQRQARISYNGARTQFGFAVALDGDTLVAGEPIHSTAPSDRGRATVFERSGTNWVLRVRLHDLVSGGVRNVFGGALAIHGDTVVVGASSALLSDTAPAPAYVFARNPELNTWRLEQQLTVGTNLFASAVAIDGDTIVVGNYRETNATGAAYVFVRNGSNWTQQARLTASDAAVTNWFGRAVAIHQNRVIVGAPRAGHSGFSSGGAVYVFERNGTQWTERTKLIASDPGPGREFGSSVGTEGDAIIVGAGFAARYYIFARDDTFWFEVHRSNASELSGLSLRDLDISGETFVVGAHTNQSGGSWSGRAYILAPQYSNETRVAEYVKRFLFYPNGTTNIFDPDRAAFRYKHLLYGSESNKVRPQLEKMSSLYGSAERQRADDARTVLLRGLVFNPAGAILRDLLLDIYYDRTVADAILAKDYLAQADRVRLGSPSVPGGFVIDDEIGFYKKGFETNRLALQWYFALLVDDLGIAGDPASGFQIFQTLVPGRALHPAVYLTTNGTPESVTGNTSPLATGYKDLILLFDLLRDHGRNAATLARLLNARSAPGDVNTAKSLVDDAQKFLHLQGTVLLGIFPNLAPVEGDGSGLAEAISGRNEASSDLSSLRNMMLAGANPLGFEKDFFMFVQKFSGQEQFFDSYDALKVRLDPDDTANPLGNALSRRDRAVDTYATYRGYQDQLATQLNQISGAAEDRLFEIVGAYPDTPQYSAPENNVGSEIWQQLRSLDGARLRIERNRVEVQNLRQQIEIEAQRGGAISNAIIRYGNQQMELTRKIGQLEAAQEAAGTLGGISKDPVSAVLGVLGAVAGATLGVIKTELEVEKERLSALEQAEIEGVNTAAQIKTLLLGMNTLVIDSKEAALLYQQEYGRLTALYREKAALEQSLAESAESFADRYFADPVHRLQMRHDTLLANLTFDEAQKWLFFMVRALEYKLNAPFTNFFHEGQHWSARTLYMLRNAEELQRIYSAIDDYETLNQPLRADYYDWFSVREDFFGYKRTDNLGQPLFYAAPDTGEPVTAIEAFRRELRRLLDSEGYINLQFSTVREIPGGSFFRGPRFNAAGQVLSEGLYLDKIKWMQISLPGSHTLGRVQLTGELEYGGTSFIRNVDMGTFDPERRDQVQDEMTAYSTRYWFFHPSGTWRFVETLSSPVTMQISSDPRVPPTVQQLEIFKERSVATTGWKLAIPTRDLGQTVLKIDELDDVEIYFYHYAVTRLPSEGRAP